MGAKRRAIVVDGEPVVAAMLCVELEDAGFEVLPAATASAAVSHADRSGGPIAVTVIDLDVHTLDEACRIFRAVRKASPKALVILAASQANPALPADCAEASVLVKPYTPEELNRLLDRAAA